MEKEPHLKLYRLKTDFSIERLHAIYYSEFSKDHVFAGEKHNFWEFMYVSRGVIYTSLEDLQFTLQTEEAILIPPNQFHRVFGNGQNSSDVITISFASDFKGFYDIAGKTLKTSQIIHTILINIIGELGIKDTFTYKVNLFLQNKSNQPMLHHAIKIYLELLLIHLFRENVGGKKDVAVTIKEIPTEDDSLFAQMVQYLNENIDKNYNLSLLSRQFLLSKERVRQIFLKCSGMNFKRYYIHLKIEKAKVLLRETNYSVTEISEFLGYTSIHYFSEVFTATVGISPKHYRASLFVH